VFFLSAGWELGISVFLLSLAHTHITIKIDAIHWGICLGMWIHAKADPIQAYDVDDNENSNA
jgi:hypothetical protein